MTTVTKTQVQVLSPTAVAAASAGTKGAPGAASAWTDLGVHIGGTMMLTIQNGGAVGTAGNILVQTAVDISGTRSVDVWGYGGDLLAYNAATQDGIVTRAIDIPPGVRFARVIGWGHSTNPVTYSADFDGVTVV
jgi:hypothetical protein